MPWWRCLHNGYLCVGHIDWEGTRWSLWGTRNILTLDLAGLLHGYTYIHIGMYIHIDRYVYPWNNTLKICALYCMLYTKKKEKKRKWVWCGHCLQITIKWAYCMRLTNTRKPLLPFSHVLIWPPGDLVAVMPIPRGTGGWEWGSQQGQVLGVRGEWVMWLRRGCGWHSLGDAGPEDQMKGSEGIHSHAWEGAGLAPGF